MYSEEIPAAFNLESTVLSSLKELYEKQLAYDVIITVGEGLTKQEFKAHKCILCIRSPYFYKHFLEIPTEEGLALFKDDESGTVFKEMSPLVFTIILKLVLVAYHKSFSFPNVDLLITHYILGIFTREYYNWIQCPSLLMSI